MNFFPRFPLLLWTQIHGPCLWNWVLIVCTLISQQSDWVAIMRQVEVVNAYCMFPRRATTTGMVVNMTTRVTKPMRIATAINQRGDVCTHTYTHAPFTTKHFSHHLSTVTIQPVKHSLWPAVSLLYSTFQRYTCLLTISQDLHFFLAHYILSEPWISILYICSKPGEVYICQWFPWKGYLEPEISWFFPSRYDILSILWTIRYLPICHDTIRIRFDRGACDRRYHLPVQHNQVIFISAHKIKRKHCLERSWAGMETATQSCPCGISK